ncbi:MAG: hypothetical protein Q8L65_12145 [Burkholderiales bacterium]|nr:hypothetical protein [Burkholderiales bacterium]
MADKSTANMERIRERWGTAAPDWIIVLAESCDQFGQTSLARRLGCSSAMISATLSNTYAGRLEKLEQRVRGELMNERVTCPVLGEISKRQCLDEQTKPYASTNALRVELRRACAGCENHIRRSA